MPNGGFGCAFCVNLERGKCALRGAQITKDHWTVCADVHYRANTFGLPTGKIHSIDEPKDRRGSIFSITGSEGAYIEVPWLGNHEIQESQVGSQKCSFCAKSVEKFHSISVLGEWFYFCCFKDYLLWRNEKILQGFVEDAVYDPDKIDKYFKDFTELEIIAAVSSERSRQRANKIESRRFLAKRALKFVLWLGMLGALILWFGCL